MGKPYVKLLESPDGMARVYRFDSEIRPTDFFGDDARPTRDVMVSDAVTHIERLVFPVYAGDCENGWPMREEVCAALGYAAYASMIHIEGRMTSIIGGGNPSSVEPDEAYLDRLATTMGGE